MTQMNLFVKQNRFTGIQNRLVIAKAEGRHERVVWELGVSRCQLFHMGWMNNNVLLHSSGKYIPYPVINQNRKEHEKEYISI